MFNDEDVKNSAIKGVIFVICFVFLIGALVMGLIFSLGGLGGAEPEAVQPESAPTAKYEKEEVTNQLPSMEASGVCNHKWVFSEEYSTLVRNVELECVASDGIEVVYLTRYRGRFDTTGTDVYIAYTKNLRDITIQTFDGTIEIEYFPAGVGMGTPRLEEYEFTLYACENEECNEFKHVPAEKQKLYRFYIPEGTYLISH